MSYVWEQRKLGEIGSASSGVGFPNSEQGGKEGIPFYKVSDMNLEGNEIEMTVSNNYVTKEQIARKKWSPLNDVPAMYFAKVGAAVMLNRKRLCRFPFLFDNNTMAYSLNKEYWDINFAKAEFAKIDLTKLVQVGALPSYNANDVESIKIMIPSLFEQSKIGNYFDELDRLITLHQRKILLYKYFLTIVWEQRKLGDCTFLSGKKNKNNLNLEPYAITNEHGFIPQNKAHDEFGYMKDTDRRAYNIVSKNSFAYNPARINIGSIGYYKGTENVIISSLYEVFQTVDSVYDPFLWQWFKTKDFQNWIIRLQEGSVRLYFYYDKLCECIIRMPKLEEQIKIANYFEALDNLITLHRCKCIFYRKNMVNAWEQRKVSDVAEIIAGGTPKTSVLEYWNPKEVPWLSSGEVHKKYITYTDDKISKKGLDHSSAKIIKENSVLIALAGQGKTRGTVAINRIPLSTNQSIAAMIFNDNIVPEFIFSNLDNRYNELRRISSGDGSRGGLNKLLIGNIIIPYTDKLEQDKIGQFFSLLDHLITLHQWKYIVCTKIKVNTWIQCKFIKIGVKLQKCILLSIILLFKRRKVSCVFYVNILLRFIKVIELEVELVFVIIDGTIIVMFYLKIRCLYLNIFIFKINK